MNEGSAQLGNSLKLVRSFSVPRERLFQAWTEPEELKKWWQLGHGWKLTVAEVDLRVGGKYTIGLSSTHNDAWHKVSGTFREVSIPERLVYTWSVEDSRARQEESIVTVEFIDRGSSSELVLKHERIMGKEPRESNYNGWLLVLDGLTKMLS